MAATRTRKTPAAPGEVAETAATVAEIPKAPRPAPKRPKAVPFDLPGLLAAADGKASLWRKGGIKFDHDHVSVVGWVLLRDEPAVSLSWQTYDEKISPKFLARIEAGAGTPVGDIAAAIAKLMARGYELVETPAAVPVKRGRKPRKEAV